MYGSGMRAATFANDMLVAGSYDVLDAVCVCVCVCACTLCHFHVHSCPWVCRTLRIARGAQWLR